VLARELAQSIYDMGQGEIEEDHVRIESQIGIPNDNPQAATAQIIMADGVPVSKVKSETETLIDEGLRRISDLTMRFVKGEITVF
jgi:S-adenosylmethionine synthetase